ncbi:MAG: ATP-dependent 6-phosphofructokinase [bacterium]|nr:ATP-dependent 6-phosphofructokinase [bacterium]
MSTKKIGILTGGGDCPGLNAAIRAVVRKGIKFYNYEMFGIKNGWAGLINGDISPLTMDSISGILHKGGTILGTSRTNPYKKENGIENIKKTIKKFGLDVIVAIGGEDTIGAAAKLFVEGINVVGIPKTIDNDLFGTEYTFGFDTAVSIITEAIDRLHTTAESHHRIMVLEVMGRHAGWLATYGGIAGGADLILIPEEPFDLEKVCQHLKNRHNKGKHFSVVVVSEGAKEINIGKLSTTAKQKDDFGHERLGGIGDILSKEIEKNTGFETRVTVLGHTQRGGSPTAFDRILATRFGLAAIDLVHENKFGFMVGLQNNKIVPVPLKEVLGKLKTVPPEFYDLAKVFFEYD